MIARYQKVGLIFVSACVVVGAALAIAPEVTPTPEGPSLLSNEASSSRTQKGDFRDLRSDLVLDFPAKGQFRRKLPNGSEYFAVSGSVTNVGSAVTKVPPLMIQLKDDQGAVVYGWEVTAQKDILDPGESMNVSEATTEMPLSATTAEVSWAEGSS